MRGKPLPYGEMPGCDVSPRDAEPSRRGVTPGGGVYRLPTERSGYADARGGVYKSTLGMSWEDKRDVVEAAMRERSDIS